ncbi:MAG: MBL fold metallo-hydrolase, partial [Bacteroidetes bacterium]
MDFRLTILGSSGAVPAWGRFPSAQALLVKDTVYLIDCGEGAQMRMQEYGIGPGRIRQIFISHLHGDHILGLMGLLQSMSLMRRSAPMTIFSPAGLRPMIEAFQSALSGSLLFGLEFVEVPVDRRQKVFEDHQVEVHAFPLKHHGMAVGYLFREKPRPRRMRGAAIGRYGIPYTAIPAIKEGGDWVAPDGRVVPNEELTEPPPPARSYAYCCDTAWDPAVAEAVQGVDLLYHDATFGEEH